MKRLILALSIFITACTTIDDRSIVKSNVHSCDEIFEEKLETENYKVHKKVIEGTGHLVSYTLAGAGFLADSIVVMTVGVVVPVVACSPFIMLGEQAADPVARCVVEIGGALLNKSHNDLDDLIGVNVYKKTKRLRCPEVKWYKETLNEIATCYKNNGDDERYQRQLEAIKYNKILNDCL